jgi:hypothetical protein
MFETLIWITMAVAVLGMAVAFDGSRDIFHPLMYVSPMFLFLYGWMPLRMLHAGQLTAYFTDQQLVHIQWLNLAGVTAFVGGCLFAGCRVKRRGRAPRISDLAERRLMMGGAVAGSLGLAAWLVTIVNVGGFVNAFSRSYGGGWDDNGYVRDGAIMMLAGVLLIHAAIALGRPRAMHFVLLIVFATPWFIQAMLTARRGPTFTFVVIAIASWFLYRNQRPPVLVTLACGLVLGWFILFLVANRGAIHLGSDFEFTTDVASSVETSRTGNEFVYGSGTVVAAEKRGHYYWARRYLAQVLVRPIPSSIWPTKYADFGVPELLKNAGTGEGIGDAMGWEGAPGSAPGIIADLFLEFWWFCIAVMALAGWFYGKVWRLAMERGGVWISQYAVCFALAIYFVMQTMEAVIFRTVLLSVPLWLTWRWARSAGALRSPVMRLARHAVRA